MLLLKTIFRWTAFWIYMLHTIIYFIPIGIMTLFKMTKTRRGFVTWISRTWAKFIIFASGSKLIIEGEENIPTDNNYSVISNHQGYLDIPTIMATMPSTVAFVAKKELKSFPIIGWWMSLIGVVYIDRSNRRQAVEVINVGAERIKNGHPMVIFPEGTRSKGGPVAKFKAGSLKMAIRSEAKIVPISIDGTYKILEENNYKIKGAKVKVTIHPSVDVSKLTDEEKKGLAQKLEDMIKSKVTVK